jgi:hypothetical protein
MIFEIYSDIYSEFGLQEEPIIQENISFLEGAFISESFTDKLRFTCNYSKKSPPSHMLGGVIPVMSEELIYAFLQAGVSNLQCFSVILESEIDRYIWSNYYAVNVVGLIACADIENSESELLCYRPGEDSVPLYDFVELRVDVSKALGAKLFRLAESPSILLTDSSVVKFLRKIKTDDQWGISFFNVS